MTTLHGYGGLIRNTVRLLVFTIAALSSACSQSVGLAATEVLNNTNCKGAETGLRVVSFSDVARLRGSTLIDMTAPNGDPNEEMLLFAMSNGRQPTSGYFFRLRDATLENTTAELVVQWHSPDPDSVQAQVSTYPCMVVGLERAAYNRVRAVGVDGSVLGEIRL